MICLLTGSFGSGITVSPEPFRYRDGKAPRRAVLLPATATVPARGTFIPPTSFLDVTPPRRSEGLPHRRRSRPGLYGAGMPSRPRLLIAFLVVLDLVLVGTVWS